MSSMDYNYYSCRLCGRDVKAYAAAVVEIEIQDLIRHMTETHPSALRTALDAMFSPSPVRLAPGPLTLPG